MELGVGPEIGSAEYTNCVFTRFGGVCIDGKQKWNFFNKVMWSDGPDDFK